MDNNQEELKQRLEEIKERIRQSALKSGRNPEGIELVMVNGKVAVDRGDHTGAMAGRVLRKAW